MDEATIHLLVKGRVQGVGFRWYVVEHARRLNVAGWVKNRDDGSVELRASGDAGALSAFENEVEKGPAGARISAVEHVAEQGVGALDRPFSIGRE